MATRRVRFTARDADGLVGAGMLTFTTAAPSARPDASNTGVPAGTVLTASGTILANVAGQVIEGKNVTGNIRVTANNVTIRKNKVKLSGAAYCIDVAGNVTGLLIEDNELDGSGIAGAHGINRCGQGIVQRNNIHHTENAIADPGANFTIRDNWMHTFASAGGPHYDGVQIDGGASNGLISHNHIDLGTVGQTAAVMIDNWAGSVSNITVDNNLAKGGSFTFYADSRQGSALISGCKYTNNRIIPGQFGSFFISGNNTIKSGNVHATTGAPL